MFNSIAATQHRALGRDTVSIGLSALLIGGAFALALALPAPERVAEIEKPPLPDITEVMMRPMGAAAAASAPKRKAAGKREASVPAAQPSRQEPAAVLTDLPVVPVVEEPPVGGGLGDDGPPGPPGGGDGITDLGDGKGKGRGPGDGTATRRVHSTELAVKLRVQPRFPEAARALGRNEENCVLRITVNEQGEPVDVSPRTCPELYRAAAVEAAYGWRWYPLIENGVGQRAQFDLNFVFRLQ